MTGSDVLAHLQQQKREQKTLQVKTIFLLLLSKHTKRLKLKH